MDLSKICTPAVIYLVISLLSTGVLVSQKTSAVTIFFHTICVLIWAFLLNALCSKGYKNISWFLVIIPYIIMIGMVIVANSVVKSAITSITNAYKGAAFAQNMFGENLIAAASGIK